MEKLNVEVLLDEVLEKSLNDFLSASVGSEKYDATAEVIEMIEKLRLKRVELDNDMKIKLAQLEKEVELKTKQMDNETELKREEFSIKNEEIAKNDKHEKTKVKLAIFTLAFNAVVLTGATIGCCIYERDGKLFNTAGVKHFNNLLNYMKCGFKN